MASFKSTVALLQAALLASTTLAAEGDPTFTNLLGPNSIYENDGNGDKMQYPVAPADDEERTAPEFDGNFWVDGYTNVAVDEETEVPYLWVFATVHAPQLLKGSQLTIFGQHERTTSEIAALSSDSALKETAIADFLAELLLEDDAEVQTIEEVIADETNEENQAKAKELVNQKQLADYDLAEAKSKQPLLNTFVCKVTFEADEDKKQETNTRAKWQIMEISGHQQYDESFLNQSSSLQLDENITSYQRQADDYTVPVYTVTGDKKTFVRSITKQVTFSAEKVERSDSKASLSTLASRSTEPVDWKNWAFDFDKDQDKSNSNIEIFEDTQYITTCAVYTKLSTIFPEADTDDLLTLAKTETIKMRFGFQAKIATKADENPVAGNQDPTFLYYGNSAQIEQSLVAGAMQMMASISCAVTLLLISTF